MEKKITNKKPDATPYFCKQNLSRMHHIDSIHTLCQCSFLYLEPRLHVSGADQAEQQWRNWQQKLVWVNSIKTTLEVSGGLNWQIFFFQMKSEHICMNVYYPMTHCDIKQFLAHYKNIFQTYSSTS